MKWRTFVAAIMISAYFLTAVQTGNWTGSIHLLVIAIAIFAKGQQAEQNARGGITEAPSDSPLLRAFEALRAETAGQTASIPEIEEQVTDGEDLTPLMSDADYARIAKYLSERMPHMTVNNLYDPTMRRFIEGKLLEGSGIGDLETLLGVPPAQAQVRRMESYGTAIDPRMQAARDQNQRQIDGLHAAIPKSQTAAGIAQNAQERVFRQHHPKSVMIVSGIKAGSRQIRVRMRPSRMQNEIASALKYGIHAGLAELQALRAPVTRITRDGRLTSAPTELHSIPPRFIR